MKGFGKALCREIVKEKVIKITFCSLFILIIFVMAIITITNNNGTYTLTNTME